jgi:hypothetical protein
VELNLHSPVTLPWRRDQLKAQGQSGFGIWHCYVCDNCSHFNDLKIKRRGQQKLMSDVSVAVSTFEMKLKLLRKEFENVNLCHFSSCDLLHITKC